MTTVVAGALAGAAVVNVNVAEEARAVKPADLRPVEAVTQ
jgi:hypothetical protein